MQLPIQTGTTLLAQAWEAEAGPEQLASIARACDEAGFLYVGVCDHVAVPRDRAAAMSTTWWDTVATLGYLAAITRQVRLLSHVYVLPYRHPMITAKAFATLDRLSAGRVILGVGAGHLEGEFDMLGVDFARRGALLDEAIDLVARALCEEFPEHDGPTWPVRDLGARPRPVQQPRPPIWIGGSTPAALRRAARRGDGWLPQGTPREHLGAQIASLREQRERHRPGEPLDVGAASGWLYLGRPGFDVGPGVKAGSADELAEWVNELGRLGANHVQVRFKTRSCDELVEQIRRFGGDVMPLLGAPNH